MRTCQGLFDICIAYGAPLISGKDSMKNDFDDGVVRLSIPPTLLVSAIGKVPDSLKSVTMQFKSAGDALYVLSAGTRSITGSHYAALFEADKQALPTLDLEAAAQLYRKLFEAIQLGMISSAHDLSEGGLAVALAECCIGSNFGAHVSLEDLRDEEGKGRDMLSNLFGEGPGAILVSIPPKFLPNWESFWSATDGISNNHIGTVSSDGRLLVSSDAGGTTALDIEVRQLKTAWLAPLPFE